MESYKRIFFTWTLSTGQIFHSCTNCLTHLNHYETRYILNDKEKCSVCNVIYICKRCDVLYSEYVDFQKLETLHRRFNK